MRKSQLFAAVAACVWQKDWVVHSEPVGSGDAAFKYLAPYIFRVAICNQRILKLEAGHVSFKYKESATHQLRFVTVTAAEFIRRFLQHVLPPRFVKVRYYGLLSPTNRMRLARERRLLSSPAKNLRTHIAAPVSLIDALLCPLCGGRFIMRATLKPTRLGPP